MAKAYKGIIFDMDGLLFDTELVYYQAQKAVAPKYGLTNYTKEYYLQYVGQSDKEFHPALYRDFADAGEKNVKGFIEESYVKVEELFSAGSVPLKPGVLELLAYFKENNIPCVIASSNFRRYIDVLVASKNIGEYFVDIVSAEDVKNAKPAPEIVLKAAKVLAVDPSECLMFEDSANGIKASHGAGVDVIMVPDLIEPTPALEEMTLAILDSLHDVPAYLEK
ncbi:HAD family phosphatase [Vagococcus coleopterorum]|uniref:HAD family phosphatase n=1 Tax=Vagococcus coleopterorum TaxID=2714946 RepID=A0A6G8APK8_9ENTE|nr:HAD family phosphatase [Vagococcus coleopterorum]QIL46910.1 HAD family phosphatase [Vagococcus coleopterorum]